MSTKTESPFDTAAAAAAAVRDRAPAGWEPEVLVCLGSGLGPIADDLGGAPEIPYSDIPGMEASTAPGHAGRFVLGEIAGVDVLCMQGRLHPYEGLSPVQVTLPVRAARMLGAHAAVLTNAAGAVNRDYRPGQVVAIADHINMTGANPLVGPDDPRLGRRFPDMTRAWSPRLRAAIGLAASSRGRRLSEGVYLGLTGPSFETPAEIRAFRALGADLVGMSTVWEAIVAVQCGMEVAGLSLVSNMAAGIADGPLAEEDVLAAARRGCEDMAALIEAAVIAAAR